MGFWDDMIEEFKENAKREVKSGIGIATNAIRDEISARTAPKPAPATAPIYQVVQNPMFQTGAVIITAVVVGFLFLSSGGKKKG